MGWETDYYDLGDCPCGKGEITRAHHSPDNGWSRSYDTIEIDCPTCSKLWDVEFSGDFLVEKTTKDASYKANAAATRARDSVVAYLNSLLPAMSLPTFNTMAAEFENLSQAGLYHGTVGQYRYARRSANMKDLAEVRSDSAIVSELIQKVGDAATYEALVAAAEVASDEAATRAAAVQRKKVPKGSW